MSNVVKGRDMVAPVGSERVLTAADGVTWSGSGGTRTLRIKGEAISKLGTQAKGRADDVSAPGLALWIY